MRYLQRSPVIGELIRVERKSKKRQRNSILVHERSAEIQRRTDRFKPSIHLGTLSLGADDYATCLDDGEDDVDDNNNDSERDKSLH
jgi:hypothetical protein